LRFLVSHWELPGANSSLDTQKPPFKVGFVGNTEVIQFDGLSPYTANLCPSGGEKRKCYFDDDVTNKC
jgi:hypothetical protein